MIRFIHTADWQLGMTRHFLKGEAQPRFTAARIDAIRSIGELAVAEDCSFVVVSGDVYESNQVERQVIVRSLEAMKAFPDVRFFLLPGNHDPLDAASIFSTPAFQDACPPNVEVLDNTSERVVARGVSVLGAPWLTKRPLADLVAAAAQELVPDGTIRIIVGHGATDTLSPNPNDPALIVLENLERAIDAGSVHYVALGDRHSTTSVGGNGRIWYSGAPEPTDYVEVDPGNALVVAIDEGSVSVEAHRVGTWSFLTEDFDITGPLDCERVREYLDAITHKDRTIVKLALVGQVSLAEKAELDRTLDSASELLAALEYWERRSELVALPDADDFDSLGLTGYASDGLNELRALGEGSTDQAAVARDALGLLYRLSGASR